MIRLFCEKDLAAVMQIWLETNIKTHNFISKYYWIDNFENVKKILPQAEVYVYVNDITNQVEGFIGITGNLIAGLFVKECVQSQGIGRQLLDYVKGFKSSMKLNVYDKNTRAIEFYKREQFVIQFENMDDNTSEKEMVMVWNR